VEAILQYIYSFKYEELGAQKKTTKNTVLYHLGAYKAAQKYQMKVSLMDILPIAKTPRGYCLRYLLIYPFIFAGACGEGAQGFAHGAQGRRYECQPSQGHC